MWVREAETAEWRLLMEEKSTLQLYHTKKLAICEEVMFDHGADSTLLFKPRAGMLQTLMYRRRYESSPGVQAARCRVCGEDVESIEHIVLLCHKLELQHTGGVRLVEALGFIASTDATTSSSAAGNKRLRCWFKVTRWRN